MGSRGRGAAGPPPPHASPLPQGPAPVMTSLAAPCRNWPFPLFPPGWRVHGAGAAFCSCCSSRTLQAQYVRETRRKQGRTDPKERVLVPQIGSGWAAPTPRLAPQSSCPQLHPPTWAKGSILNGCPTSSGTVTPRRGLTTLAEPPAGGDHGPGRMQLGVAAGRERPGAGDSGSDPGGSGICSHVRQRRGWKTAALEAALPGPSPG